MKSNLNINFFIIFFLILFSLCFNQVTWLLFFDADGYLKLSDKVSFAIINITTLFNAFLIFINRDNNNYLYSISKLYFLNIILLIFFLITLELLFGNWFNPNKLNHLNLIKNQVRKYELNELYPSKNNIITYTRDEWGFRGYYPSVEDIDILTIGGSTTDQRYISDGNTFQDILHDEFKKNSQNIHVVNAGIDGQSSYGHIKNFELWFPNIPQLKVKYCLFFIGINDFHVDDKWMGWGLHKRNVELVDQIKSRSALYYLYRTIKGIVITDMNNLNHGRSSTPFSKNGWTNKPELSDYEDLLADRLSKYEKNLIILCKKVNEMGSKPIFVSQSKRRLYDFNNGVLFGTPNISNYKGHQYNGVDYYYMIRLFHDRLKKVSKQKGAIFINLDDELVFDLKHDLYDTGHFSLLGVEKIGKYLYKMLNYLFNDKEYSPDKD